MADVRASVVGDAAEPGNRAAEQGNRAAAPAPEPSDIATPARPGRARRWLARLLVPVLAVLLGLAVGAIAIVAAGGSVIDAYRELIIGAVGTPSNLAATLARAVPITVVAVGLALAFRAGCFNLGAEGQMIVSAITAAVVAITFPTLPGALLILASILAGCAVGGLWALGPAWLQTRFDVPLLITTLLLNYVAALLAAYLVSYPLRDMGGGAALAQTVAIPTGAQLPYLVPGGRLHAGVLVLLVLPVVAWWLQRRTVLGYEMRMTGHNRWFADYGGVDGRRTVLLTMLISGAVCGLAGALLVLGVHYRYIDNSIVGPGYAWTGFTAALLAYADPLGSLFAGLFLAALEVGAAGMERRTEIPIQIVDILQAAIILTISIRIVLGRWVGQRLGTL
jgi:general nucleoside transport system permease protein